MPTRKRYNDGGIVASTILEQLGGIGRLKVMTGAYNFIDIGNGVSFKMKNPRANYVKIKLNSLDLYDLEVGRIRGDSYKVVSEHKNVYAEDLKPLIEKASGLYLSFADGGYMANGGMVKKPLTFGELKVGQEYYEVIPLSRMLTPIEKIKITEKGDGAYKFISDSDRKREVYRSKYYDNEELYGIYQNKNDAKQKAIDKLIEKMSKYAMGGKVDTQGNPYVNVYARMKAKDYFGVESKGNAVKWFKLNARPMSRKEAENWYQTKKSIDKLGKSNVYIGNIEYGYNTASGERRRFVKEDGGMLAKGGKTKKGWTIAEDYSAWNGTQWVEYGRKKPFGYFLYNENTGERKYNFLTKEEAERKMKSLGYKYEDGGMMADGGRITKRFGNRVSHTEYNIVFYTDQGTYKYLSDKDGNPLPMTPLQKETYENLLKNGNNPIVEENSWIEYIYDDDEKMANGGEIFQIKNSNDRYYSQTGWNQSPDLGYLYSMEDAEKLVKSLAKDFSDLQIVKYNKDWWKMADGGKIFFFYDIVKGNDAGVTTWVVKDKNGNKLAEYFNRSEAVEYVSEKQMLNEIYRKVVLRAIREDNFTYYVESTYNYAYANKVEYDGESFSVEIRTNGVIKVDAIEVDDYIFSKDDWKIIGEFIKEVKDIENDDYARGGKVKKKWIQEALKNDNQGVLRKTAKRKGLLRGDENLSQSDLNKLQKMGGKTAKRAHLAETLRKFDYRKK